MSIQALKFEMIEVIKEQSGVAFQLKKGQTLKVIDPFGQQVSDMVLFCAKDIKEKISSGKTLDFEKSILLTKKIFYGVIEVEK